MMHRLPHSLRLFRWALTVAVVLVSPVALSAEVPPEQAAGMVLDSARRAYNEKNYPFAAERFREFLSKYGKHKEANSAHYGLALCLIEGPSKDYKGAIQQLRPIAEDGSLKEHPFVLYYLALSERGLGTQEQELADAKTGDANMHRDAARRRFEEASKHFAAAVTAFTGRISQPPKGTPIELEWAARARCDQAEMLLRLHKAKEAQAAAAPFVRDAQLRKSRYRGLGLYYHGFACFLLGDNLAAGRSLSLLTPFSDPVFGTHARYLLARVHHAAGERPEARSHYEGAIAEHNKQKQAATEALRQPERFKNDPREMNRLERLAYGRVPDHVARAAFFLGVLQYEDGRFAEAAAQLNTFRKQSPNSPVAAEAQLHVGFCQVQLKQFAEAQRTLQPLADREPRLADQALLWLARAQIGAADPANRPAYEQALKSAAETLRKAADRAGQTAKAHRGEILLELADTQQLARQYRESAGTYNQILAGKLLPRARKK